MANEQKISLFSALENFDSTKVSGSGASFRTRINAIEYLKSDFLSYKQATEKRSNPSELVQTILRDISLSEEKMYFQLLLDKLDGGPNQSGKMKDRISRFLDWYGLRMDTDTIVTSSDAVTLSTIHQSKGKEWKVVFLIGITKDQFPSPIYSITKEEEVRTFYVGLSRAQEKLFMRFFFFHFHLKIFEIC